MAAKEQHEDSLKKKKKKQGMELPYDPAIPLLAIYPVEIVAEWGTCIPMFAAHFFTVARTWKQPRCQSTDE